jgi:hypothetical protein
MEVMELGRIQDRKIVELRPFIYDTAKLVEVYG